MQRSNNVVSDKFKVLVSNPLLNIPLSTSKEVIDNSDFMTHEHQSINKVWANESRASSYLQ